MNLEELAIFLEPFINESAAICAENARLRESAELNADYHRREMKLQTEIASLALEGSSAIKAENARLREALEEINKRDSYPPDGYGVWAEIARAALEVKP
jgi:hypothetical protein